MKNKINILYFLLILSLGVIFFLIFHKQYPKNRTSQILVNTNQGVYIYDIDRNATWQVPSAKFAYGWSPLGEQLLYKNDEGLWVSNYDGEKPRKIFGVAEYPQLEKVSLPDAIWLTDYTILVYLAMPYEEGSLYSIDLQLKTIENLPAGGELIPSPNGNLWLQTNINVYVATLNGASVLANGVNSNGYIAPVLLNGSSYWFSPDGRLITYPVRAHYPDNAELWIANVSRKGLADNRLLVEPQDCNTQFGGDVRWSPNGRQVGYFGYKDSQSLFCVSNAKTGKEEIVWPFRHVGGVFLWSPNSDAIATHATSTSGQIIMKLDLSSGKSTILIDKNILGLEKTDVYMVDWRLLPAP
jgi:hypothetical protein